MNLLIIGATRGIGRQLLNQSLAQGHAVTVLARDPARLNRRHRHLCVVSGDVQDPGAVDRAMSGQDAVCLTIGTGPHCGQVRVYSAGTHNVLEAMQKHSVGLLVCVTGIGAGDSRGHGGFLYDRIVQPLLLGGVYRDKERQEDLIRSSGIDWVIVRPGFLTNGPLTRRYRVLTELKGVTAGRISRADVADFILGQLAVPSQRGRTPLLTY